MHIDRLSSGEAERMDQLRRKESGQRASPERRQPSQLREDRTVRVSVIGKFVVDKIKLSLQVNFLAILFDLVDPLVSKVPLRDQIRELDCCRHTTFVFKRDLLRFFDEDGNLVPGTIPVQKVGSSTVTVSFPLSVYFGHFRSAFQEAVDERQFRVVRGPAETEVTRDNLRLVFRSSDVQGFALERLVDFDGSRLDLGDESVRGFEVVVCFAVKLRSPQG